MGVGIWDRDLRCLHANATLMAMARNGSGGGSADVAPAAAIPTPAPGLAAALRSVLASGQPVADIAIEGVASEVPGVHLRANTFPLREEGQIVGAAAIVAEASGTLERQRELEQRLSVEEEIAGVLEESLLPEALPHLERLELAARYHPAGERARVGGDFYDVFEARGTLVLVIGDVAGKGAKAATLTALVRHVARAIALYERRPALLLERMREMLVARGDEQPVTLICAVIEHPRRARKVTIASAAHPLPLLVRRNGVVGEVGGINPLLRYTEPGSFKEATVSLRRGDRLFFYTDGLTDARAPQQVLSPDELGGAVSGREGLELGQLLDNVIGWAVGPEARPRDDIAVLALERR